MAVFGYDPSSYRFEEISRQNLFRPDKGFAVVGVHALGTASSGHKSGKGSQELLGGEVGSGFEMNGFCAEAHKNANIALCDQACAAGIILDLEGSSKVDACMCKGS